MGVPSNKNGRGRHGRLFGLKLSCLAALLLQHGVSAATFDLPKDGGSLIGSIQEVVVGQEDTFVDIARRYEVAFSVLVAANPGVDPWVPPVGTNIIVPTQYLLPNAPRKGIVVNLPEMRLYYYLPPHPEGPRQVMTFPIGIGSEGRTIPLGLTKVIKEAINPPWFVPESIRAEHAKEGDILPAIVPPGPDNPLGNYALRLGFGSFLIHGTNHPYSVGMRISHGCLRLYPESIESLYSQVRVNTPVRIIDQPFKAGWYEGNLYIEAHAPLAETNMAHEVDLKPLLTTIIAAGDQHLDEKWWKEAVSIYADARGIPVSIPIMKEKVAQASHREPLKQASWMYQIGVYRNMPQAAWVRDTLTKLGVPVYERAAIEGGPCHVGAGPFQDRDTARTTGATIMHDARLQGIVMNINTLNSYECGSPAIGELSP